MLRKRSNRKAFSFRGMFFCKIGKRFCEKGVILVGGKVGNTAEKISYSKKLSEMMDELHISQSKLGKAIGKSQKTVSRYVLGETLPDEETQIAIAEFIQGESVYDDFQHIPSESFAKLLEALLQEFRGEITQAQLAQRIGRYQKDISFYTYNAVKPDTKTQRDIIKVFYELCKAGHEISSRHFGTAVHLEYLLYGEDGNMTYLLDTADLKYGDKAGCGGFIRYMLSLPVKLLDFIINHFEAFYDEGLEICSDFTFRFQDLSYGIKLFRQLSKKQQAEIVEELEKDTFLGYPKHAGEWNFYKLMTTYRHVIATDMQKLQQDKRRIADGKEREDYIQQLECCMGRYNFRFSSDKEMIEEVRFKLTQTQYEWYVTLLFLVYWFKGKDFFQLCSQMQERIHNF